MAPGGPEARGLHLTGTRAEDCGTRERGRPRPTPPSSWWPPPPSTAVATLTGLVLVTPEERGRRSQQPVGREWTGEREEAGVAVWPHSGRARLEQAIDSFGWGPMRVGWVGPMQV
jgi:hypothetical protein